MREIYQAAGIELPLRSSYCAKLANAGAILNLRLRLQRHCFLGSYPVPSHNFKLPPGSHLDSESEEDEGEESENTTDVSWIYMTTI